MVPWREGVLIHIVIRVIMFLQEKGFMPDTLSCFTETPCMKVKEKETQRTYTLTQERDEEAGATGVSRTKQSPFKKLIPQLILHVDVGSLVILRIQESASKI